MHLTTTRKSIVVVGEMWGRTEEERGRSFTGAASNVLFSLLAQAGIDKNECHFTNVLEFRPSGGRLENVFTNKAGGIPNYRPVQPGKYLRASLAPELERLQKELAHHQPNLIIALGNLSLWALCKKSGIKKYRGSPLLTHDNSFKVIPTWSPASILRQWELRPIVLADLTKSRTESRFSALRRPTRYIYLEPSISDIADFYDEHLLPSPFVSCDIETKGKQITEVGYATADGKHAMVIPFYSRLADDGNYWPSLALEKQAWKWVRKINETLPTIGQNFAYDMTYFWQTVGIPCPRFLGDTMLLHHSLQPELEKGLGFLGSIYTNEPSWKFMRTDHSTLKRGDD